MNIDLRFLGILLKNGGLIIMIGFVIGVACGSFIGILIMCLMKISADE